MLVDPHKVPLNSWKMTENPTNMVTVVPDISIIIKWLNKDKEENLEQASKLLEEVLDGKVELLAPELVKYEIGNVLLKSKRLIPREAKISLGTIYSLPITFVSETENLSKQTFEMAYKHGITYYDAAFISLSKQYNATLVTENIKHQGKSSEIKVVSLKDY